MKAIIFYLFLCLFSLKTFAQKAYSFDEAKQNNIHTSKLDSIYKSGISSDTQKGVFNEYEEEFVNAYYKLLQDLGTYLKENNFYWEKPTKGFNRIYFDKSGKIDYFIFNFRTEQLTKDQEQKFTELLNKFIQGYTFSMQAKENFVQCSPVTYMPKEN